jgi:hypothetical protein
MSFDPVTLALAKGEIEQLKKSGAIGHEVNERYTYNGDSTGKETFVHEGVTFTKISDTAHNLAGIQSITLYIKTPDVETGEFVPVDSIPYVTVVYPWGQYDIMALVYVGAGGNYQIPVIVSVPNENPLVSVGTWVLDISTEGKVQYVSDIAFEYISPIKNEYVAGGVVDLDFGFDSHTTTGSTEYNNLDVAEIFTALSTDRPVYLTFNGDDGSDHKYFVTGVVRSFMPNSWYCDGVSFSYKSWKDGKIRNVFIERTDYSTATVYVTVT